MGDGCCGNGKEQAARTIETAGACAHPHRLRPDGKPCECAGSTVLVGAAALTGVQVPPVPLFSLGTGRLAKVCEHCLNENDAAMLRAMGMKPGASVRVCRTGEPCIVEVLPPSGGGPCGCDCSTRIGLAKDLAMRVMVVPVVASASAL